MEIWNLFFRSLIRDNNIKLRLYLITTLLLLGKISLNSCRFLYIDLPHKKWFIGSNNKLDHLKQNNLTKLPITKGKFITHPYLIWNIDIKKITQLPPWAKSLKKSINNNFNFKMKRKTVFIEFGRLNQIISVWQLPSENFDGHKGISV